jgi:hypothetical protein
VAARSTPLRVPEALALALAISIFVSLGGCSSCDGEPVPFGLDAARPRRTDAVLGASVGPAAVGDRAPLASRDLPDVAPSADIEGATLAIPGETLRAIAAWDLDGDGDRDAIAITTGDAARGPGVFVALREGSELRPQLEVHRSAVLDPGCAIEHASTQALSESFIAVDLALRCPIDEHGATRILQAIAITSAARPRVLERFVLRAREREGSSPETLGLRAEDLDHDGHADLAVTVALLVDGGDPVDVTLGLLDRPAGLARDPAEPEARIAALAGEARGALRRHPERARAGASRALALHEALCRESGHPRLEIGGVAGLACGRSSSVGRALSILVQTAARAGEPVAAIDAYARLSAPDVAARDTDREAARTTIEGLTAAAIAVHEGPAVAVPEGGLPRLGTLAFLGEDRLLVRGRSPRTVDLTNGTEMPAEEGQGALALADPSRTLRLLAIERRCEGTVVVLGGLDPLADLTSARSTALISPRRAPAGAACPDMTPALRSDDDGWRALGWAPQGLLVARGIDVRMIPLDLSGRAAGAPVVIAPGGAIPGPIAPGHATSDGRLYVRSTTGGIVVVDLASAPRSASLLRPAGWAPPDGTEVDAAISPSGRRIAWISGGRLRWVDRAEPATPAP